MEKRKIDQLVSASFSEISRRFSLTEKGKLQRLKALIFIAFLVGAIGAVVWGFSFKSYNSSSAASVSSFFNCAKEGETLRNEATPFNGKPTVCCEGLRPVFALDPNYGQLVGLTATCKKPATCALEGETIQNESLNSNSLLNQGRPKKCCDDLQPVYPADENGEQIANSVPTCRTVKCGKKGEQLKNESLGSDNTENNAKPTACCGGLQAVFPKDASGNQLVGVAATCEEPACAKEGEYLKNSSASTDDTTNNARPSICCSGLKPAFLADSSGDQTTNTSAVCVAINCAKEGEYLRNSLLDSSDTTNSKKPTVCCEGLSPIYSFPKEYKGKGETAMCMAVSSDCAGQGESLRNPALGTSNTENNAKPTICCDGLKPAVPSAIGHWGNSHKNRNIFTE